MGECSEKHQPYPCLALFECLLLFPLSDTSFNPSSIAPIRCLHTYTHQTHAYFECHNSKDVEPQVPIRLSENDVIVVGNSHLVVHISDLENQENEAAEEEEDAGDA